MRNSLAVAVVVFGAAPVFGRTPRPAKPAVDAAVTQAAPAAKDEGPGIRSQTTPPAQVKRDDVGFTFTLPAGWEVVPPAAEHQAEVPYPAVGTGRKGTACVDVALTAKHGNPASVVVVLALPFTCYGQTMQASDLADFGSGAAEGMKQSFRIADAVEADYSLGSHQVWIERAKGSAKHHPERPFTFEIACTVLERGAACWMTMAADAATLTAFEQALVSLDGESARELVPATAFAAKP
jgi:hypothetical protein